MSRKPKTRDELLFLEELDWLTTDPRGARLLVRLMWSSGYFDPPHQGSTETLNFNAGRRFACDELMRGLIAVYPDRLTACLEEFQQARNARTRSDAGASADPDPGDDAATGA